METTQEKQKQLTQSIILMLTENPKEDSFQLMTAFLDVADQFPTEQTISAFQRMLYVLNSAQEIKALKTTNEQPT